MSQYEGTDFGSALSRFKNNSGFNGLPWEIPEHELEAIAKFFWDAGRMDGRPYPQPQFADQLNAPQRVEVLCAVQDPKVFVADPNALVAVMVDDRTPAEEIYDAYPRHVGKAAALKAINKAIKGRVRSAGDDTNEVELLKKVTAYKLATDRWPKADRQFIPHPATWFNQGRYDDDPKEWSRGGVGTSVTSQFSKPSH